MDPQNLQASTGEAGFNPQDMMEEQKQEELAYSLAPQDRVEPSQLEVSHIQDQTDSEVLDGLEEIFKAHYLKWECKCTLKMDP